MWNPIKLAATTALFQLCLIGLLVSAANAKLQIRGSTIASDRTFAATNSIDNVNSVEQRQQETPTESSNPNIVNTDLMDKMSWQCANNASCLYALANGVLQSYKRGETIKFGIFDLIKLPPPPGGSKWRTNATVTGRGISNLVDFIGGNAIRIPVGPMVFSIQRAENDGDYIEVALLKKASSQARREDGVGRGGRLGGGGGGGGGGGILGGGGKRGKGHDKKQFQMFIPMYLAATTFGWTLVAAKAVGLLTLKALAISKFALIVAAMIFVKKMMDSASDKMLYQFPEHTPYMMPYSMDYPMHQMGAAEIATSDMYPAALHLSAAAPMQHHPGHPVLEGLTAESHLHHNIADVQNNTHVLAALNAAGLGQKVKREDAWIAKTAAAASLRRPLVYNYLQSHHPYYRP